jgi:hypothetical protein
MWCSWQEWSQEVSTVSPAGGRNKPPHKTASRPQLEADRVLLRVDA